MATEYKNRFSSAFIFSAPADRRRQFNGIVKCNSRLFVPLLQACYSHSLLSFNEKTSTVRSIINSQFQKGCCQVAIITAKRDYFYNVYIEEKVIIFD